MSGCTKMRAFGVLLVGCVVLIIFTKGSTITKDVVRPFSTQEKAMKVKGTYHKLRGEHIYNGMVMPGIIPSDVLDKIPHFEFHPDDVLVVTYLKAGTTWLQQILWLILNDVDVETSRKVQLHDRSPYLEIRINNKSGMDKARDMESPRLLKSHLPYSFFKNSIENAKRNFKVVIGLRNVKDVLVSLYHFYRINYYLGNFDHDFDSFFELFKMKHLRGVDYFDHVLGWWEARDNPNILFMKYEEIKANPRDEIIKMAEFLGKMLTDRQLDLIVEESSFKAMQKNPMINKESNKKMKTNISKFIRKGEVGDWQNYFTQEQVDYVDKLCKEKLEPKGLIFRDK